MPDDLQIELEQARDAFAKCSALATVDAGLAGRYLDAATSSDGGPRREWDSLFGFWRTMIRGGWRCPSCGGQMEYGESSGVRCTEWQCLWVPGRPH
jgi:hypothetical protein